MIAKEFACRPPDATKARSQRPTPTKASTSAQPKGSRDKCKGIPHESGLIGRAEAGMGDVFTTHVRSAANARPRCPRQGSPAAAGTPINISEEEGADVSQFTGLRLSLKPPVSK